MARKNSNFTSKISNLEVDDAVIHQEIENLKTSDEAITTRLDDLVTSMNELDSKILKMLPVGSIIAWSGQSLSNTELPDGWQMCDGQKILEGPMKGQNSPNINGEDRFLRGGKAFTSWTYQDHMIGQHKHSISDPGHIHTDAGHDHQVYVYGDETYPNTNHIMTAHDHGKRGSPDNVLNGKANIQSSHTSISVQGATESGIPVGNEVRPKNMIVQYIIKVL